jgi:peroxiredoxin Q/BCP
MLTVGSELPDVSVEDDEGRVVELASLAGAPLVIFFYPRADTPG